MPSLNNCRTSEAAASVDLTSRMTTGCLPEGSGTTIEPVGDWDGSAAGCVTGRMEDCSENTSVVWPFAGERISSRDAPLPPPPRCVAEEEIVTELAVLDAEDGSAEDATELDAEDGAAEDATELDAEDATEEELDAEDATEEELDAEETGSSVQTLGASLSQDQPSSTAHVALQPSPEEVSPSSQVSAPAFNPSPQVVAQELGWDKQLYPLSTVHVALQPSPEEVSPSSQVSLPVTRPSPQKPASQIYPARSKAPQDVSFQAPAAKPSWLSSVQSSPGTASSGCRSAQFEYAYVSPVTQVKTPSVAVSERPIQNCPNPLVKSRISACSSASVMVTK